MPRYLLDTNVLSELFMLTSNVKVLAWYQRQNPEDVFLATLNVAEIRFGIENLPMGKKRQDLDHWLQDVLIPTFINRTLSFDLKSAQMWGLIAARDKRSGRPRPHMDSLLAAVALAHNMTLVTRNTKDFSGLDLVLLNPF